MTMTTKMLPNSANENNLLSWQLTNSNHNRVNKSFVAINRLSIITGLDYWNRLLEWTTGLIFFALKIIFMASSKIFLLVHAIHREFLTWLPASLATSCLVCVYNNLFLRQEQYNQFNDNWDSYSVLLLDKVAHKLVKLGLIAQLLLGEVIMLSV